MIELMKILEICQKILFTFLHIAKINIHVSYTQEHVDNIVTSFACGNKNGFIYRMCDLHIYNMSIFVNIKNNRVYDVRNIGYVQRIGIIYFLLRFY